MDEIKRRFTQIEARLKTIEENYKKSFLAGQLTEQKANAKALSFERERCLKIWNKLKSRNKSMREETGFSLKMDDLEQELTKKVKEEK